VAISNSRTEIKAECGAEDPEEQMSGEEAKGVDAKNRAENSEEATVSDDAEPEEEHPNEEAANAAPRDTHPNIVSSRLQPQKQLIRL
jgi:hypothetical protein